MIGTGTDDAGREFPESTITATSEYSTVTEGTLFVHIETQRERLQRLSNLCADAFAARAEATGECDERVAEIADVLWRLSGIAGIIEHLGDFGS